MGKVTGKFWNTIGKIDPVGKKLFGSKKGKPESFIDPMLEQSNLLVAKDAFDMTRQINSDQSQQLVNLRDRIKSFEDRASNPQDLANIEIERRRRALGLQQEGANRNINAQLARRGLGGSAAGLFAQSRAQRGYQNQLADLESSRPELENQMAMQQEQRRQALYGLYGGVAQGTQRVTPKIFNPGEAGSGPAAGALIGAAGGILGGMFGGPAGAAAGKKVGDQLGSDDSSKWTTKQFNDYRGWMR